MRCIIKCNPISCMHLMLSHWLCHCRCSRGRCIPCIWIRDGSIACTFLGRRTNYRCHLCIIYSDIGDIMSFRRIIVVAISVIILSILFPTHQFCLKRLCVKAFCLSSCKISTNLLCSLADQTRVSSKKVKVEHLL